MQYTIDTYTGKRFYYDPKLTIQVGGERTVGRRSEEEHRIIYLHPSRLPKAIYQRLNGDEDSIRECDVCETWAATTQVQAGNEIYRVCDKSRCQDKVSEFLPNDFDWKTDAELLPEYEKFLGMSKQVEKKQ